MAKKNTITPGKALASIPVADPGKAGALRFQREASAIFSVGEHVMYFANDTAVGRRVSIASEYQMHRVIYQDGPYLRDDGSLAAYRFGYVTTCLDSGQSAFAAAHQLTRVDMKQSHLRLVASRSASAL